MCTVLLPPGGYPIAVKYITSYHYRNAPTEILGICRVYIVVSGAQFGKYWCRKEYECCDTDSQCQAVMSPVSLLVRDELCSYDVVLSSCEINLGKLQTNRSMGLILVSPVHLKQTLLRLTSCLRNTNLRLGHTWKNFTCVCVCVCVCVRACVRAYIYVVNFRSTFAFLKHLTDLLTITTHGIAYYCQKSTLSVA
jgi:hypothetical protein